MKTFVTEWMGENENGRAKGKSGKVFSRLQMTQKLQTTTAMDNDLKLENSLLASARWPRKIKEKRKINKKAIVFNRNLCHSPTPNPTFNFTTHFIIARDFYVVNKFSFSIVRTLPLPFS